MSITLEDRSIYRATRRAIGSLSDEHILCRSGHHSWRARTATRRRSGIERTEYCANGCECIRSQTLTVYGMVLKSSIKYPPGYLLVGLGHLTGVARGAVRIEALERAYQGS